jgi:hypothetical protein
LLVMSLCARAQSAPPEFSADIVSHDAAGTPGAVSKLRVANHKARIDPDDPSGGFFITDTEAGTAYFVKPTQRLFMDAGQSSLLSRIFVRVDPHDPCRQWQAAAIASGALSAGNWRCEQVGSAPADGIMEYRLLWPAQPLSRRWIDPHLEFPIKLQSPEGTSLMLENIRVEAQPANLFAIPADYRKLDPRALLERIKHSDVWAAPDR